MSFKEKVIPFGGIKTIDMSTVLSGPVSTMLLSDQGADVIKAESPEGDLTRGLKIIKGGLSTAYINVNRGKKPLSINLKTSEGRGIIAIFCPNTWTTQLRNNS